MVLRTSLVGHVTVYAVGLAIQGLGALVVLPLVTRALGAAGYGQVAVAIVVMTLVSMLASGGSQILLMAEHYRDDQGLGARALASTVVLASLSLGGIALPAAVVVRSDSGKLGALAVLAAAGLAVVSVQQALFRARQQPGRFLGVTLGSSLGAQATGLAATSISATAVWFMVGYAAAVWIAGAVGATFMRLVPPWRHWFEVRSRFRLLVPLLPQTFAVLALTVGDVALVSIVLGDAQAGSYQVAWLLGSVSFFSASAVANAWSPLIMRDAAATGQWRYLHSTGRPLFAAVGTIAVAVSATSPFLLPLLAPVSFDTPSLVPVVAVLVTTGPASLLYLASVNVVLRERRTTAVLALSVAGASALAAIAIVSLPIVGIVGAAIGKVVGFVVLGAGTALLSRRYAGSLLRSWRARRSSALICLGCGAAPLATQTSVAGVAASAIAILVVTAGALLSTALSAALGIRRNSHIPRQ